MLKSSGFSGIINQSGLHSGCWRSRMESSLSEFRIDEEANRDLFVDCIS